MTLTRLRIGQSADPDDAFMAWGLASGHVTVEGFDVEIEFADIETLNERAAQGSLEMTALSAAAYPRVADRYRLLRCGASFGADYGPLVVGREAPAGSEPADVVAGRRIAIPGRHTTAYLLLRIFAGDGFEPVPMRFDRVMDAVERGDVDAGLVIHEGQLTFRERGLHAWFEPARAWAAATALPLPLGVMAVRRDLGDDDGRRAADAFRDSIEAAVEHADEALEFAAREGRGLDAGTLRRFVDQYVDDLTLDMGEPGIAALRQLYRRAAAAGHLDSEPTVDPL